MMSRITASWTLSSSPRTNLPTQISFTETKEHRRIRPRVSLSPQKVEFNTPLPRLTHSNPSTSQKHNEIISTLSTTLGCLTFDEFSFEDDNGDFRCTTSDDYKRLLCYLQDQYPMVDHFQERMPYIFVWCLNEVPQPTQRPFVVAGAVAIWLVMGKNLPPQELMMVDDGGNEDRVLDVEELAEDLRKYHLPATATLQALKDRFFQSALAIGFLDDSILVELPKMDKEEYDKVLLSMPCKFQHNGLMLWYHNGLKGEDTLRELGRVMQPDPHGASPNRIQDNTDYCADRGFFQPGAIISNQSQTFEFTAGILVERNNETAMTVSAHCWKNELETSKDKLGQKEYFRVKQGETDIGYMSYIFGDTDIGLAVLDQGYNMYNDFLELPGGPTRLMSSNELCWGDYFMLDSFVTGTQTHLRTQGKRVIFEPGESTRADPVFFGNQGDLPLPGTYNMIVQGHFATSNPEANGVPIIRQGVCGSALVKGATGKRRPAKNIKGLKNTGEIGGFFHWADLQSKTNIDPEIKYFCLADACDVLIDGGWSVSSRTLKKRQEDTDPNENQDPFIDSV